MKGWGDEDPLITGQPKGYLWDGIAAVLHTISHVNR